MIDLYVGFQRLIKQPYINEAFHVLFLSAQNK